jgi:hypothetical protein
VLDRHENPRIADRATPNPAEPVKADVADDVRNGTPTEYVSDGRFAARSS